MFVKEKKLKKIVKSIPDEVYKRIHPDLLEIMKNAKNSEVLGITYRKAYRDKYLGDMPETIDILYDTLTMNSYLLETGELSMAT